jgi:hypothetical protein
MPHLIDTKSNCMAALLENLFDPSLYFCKQFVLRFLLPQIYFKILNEFQKLAKFKALQVIYQREESNCRRSLFVQSN